MVAKLPGLLRSVPPRVWGAGLQDRGRETFFLESGPRRRPCRELRAIKTLRASHARLGERAEPGWEPIAVENSPSIQQPDRSRETPFHENGLPPAVSRPNGRLGCSADT